MSPLRLTKIEIEVAVCNLRRLSLFWCFNFNWMLQTKAEMVENWSKHL